MWILEAVTLAAALASGLESSAAGGPDRFISYIHTQQVPEPRIWLDRGDDPVLESGDRVRIFYRTEVDAYVAILQIDTDGTTRMLYPRSSTENHYARAGRDYRLLFPRSAYWNVDDRPGVGYFFVVTSPVPFDFSDFGYSFYYGGWDLSVVGSTVYSDPYVAMDDYVARLVPDWEYVDYGLDFVSYNVGGVHEYPRFLCYQCHGFRPYGTWNPYRYTCLDFRVVVYDDPYFYPSVRYGGDRVVMVGPRNPTRPRFGFKERAQGEAGTPVIVVRPAERDDAPPVPGRPGTDPRAGRGRVVSPPVVPVPPPATTRGRDLSGRGEAPPVRSGGGRVTSPPVVTAVPARVRDLSAPTAVPARVRDLPAPTAVPRRPTLERRSTTPIQGTPPPPPAPGPRLTPPPHPTTSPPPAPRPSTRPPQAPPSSTRSRPTPPPSTRSKPAPPSSTRSRR